MKPLVYYSRWQGAKLRLAGRDDRYVWGHLVTVEDGSEQLQPFRFDNEEWVLYLGEGEAQQRLRLDEMGVVSETL